MSHATRHLEHHLERLLEELQGETALGGCGDRDDLCPLLSESTGVDGSCDTLGKETCVSNYESEAASTPSSCDCGKYYREETAKLVQQLGDSRVQVATLEAQIEFLNHKGEERETSDALYIRRRMTNIVLVCDIITNEQQRLEEEVLRLEETVEQEVSDLARRQNEVESKVPSIEEQFKTIDDLNVSETLYMELKAIPKQQRTAMDHILILAYEKFQELQTSRDASREALTRANDEVQRLTDDLQRVAATQANERRESLEQMEVLSAKGSLFDEVQEKYENLRSTSIDAEKEKAALAATLQETLQEKDLLRGSIQEKDHNLELLSMDKTYMSKENESLKEQIRKLESELEQQNEKLREVKRERSELRKDSLAANERFQADMLQMKERTIQDIESSRRESFAMADDKIRTYREVKDDAVATAEKCRNEARESKVACEELLWKEAETRKSLTLTNAELDELKGVLTEKKSTLDQNEASIAELKTQIEKLTEEKTALENTVSELTENLKTTREQLDDYKRAEAAKLQSLEREKSKSFSAWRADNEEGKLKGSRNENQEQPRCGPDANERMSVRSNSVQGDIRKLLRARSSVNQLHSLLVERGVPMGAQRSSKSTNHSRKDKIISVSPRISNLDRTASPTKHELQTMMEQGASPPRCYQHRACSPHYPKHYKKLVDTMSKKAPAPFSQAPAFAPHSSSPTSNSAPSSPAPPPDSPPASLSPDRNSCS